MSGAENTNNQGCCVSSMIKINDVFEKIFVNIGVCVFKFPLIVLLTVLVFFGFSCIFVSEIEAADDILELILGSDSIVVKISNWRSTYLEVTTWGSCIVAPTSAPTCSDDADGTLSMINSNCTYSASVYGCSFELTALSMPGSYLYDLCPVTCREGCGSVLTPSPTSSNIETEDCVPTVKPTEQSDTAEISKGSIVILAVDHDEDNILKPEFLLEYSSFLTRFMKNWTTTCDAYEGHLFGYKDVAIWELYDSNYMAVTDFPIYNQGILRCFREGWWSFYDNTHYRDPRLLYGFEFVHKTSLMDILNSDMTSEEQTEAISKVIQGCYQYVPAYRAAYPFGYMLGGMVFPEYTTDDLPEIDDNVIVYESENNWKAGVIWDIIEGGYTVVDAQSRSETIRTNCTMNELRQTMTKAVGLQTLFPVGIPEEFAKRVQKQHYEYCETTGDLNGAYNCTGDNHYDDIFEDAEACHRKIIEDLADAIREANEKEELLVDYAIFMPFDEENILEYVTATSASLMIICISIMVVFIAVVALNPCQPNPSKAITGSLGVILVFFSTMAGMGLCRLVFQIEFTPGSMQALPFMGLGLGVDDMLVLLWTYNYQTTKSGIAVEIRHAIREAGLSITLTSMTNFISFIIGAYMPLKELSFFSVTAACIMLTNYIAILLGFSSILVLHNRVRVRRREAIASKIGEGALNFSDHEETIKSTAVCKVKNISEKGLRLVPSLLIFILSVLLFVVAFFLSPNPEWGVSLNALIPDKHPMKVFFIYWEGYFNTITAYFGFGFSYRDGGPALRWDNYYGNKYQSLKKLYESMDECDFLDVTTTSTWITDFQEWVIEDPSRSFDNIPEEDQTSLTLHSNIESTGNPPDGRCNTAEYPLPYALCSVYYSLWCVDTETCSSLGGSRCSGGDCTTCGGLVDQLVFGGDSMCEADLFKCPEYRFGGGACFSGATANYEYIGRAGICDEPPADPSTIQTADEGPYYTIQNEDLDKDECMAWCDGDDECIGFIYWMWPQSGDTYSLVSNGGCRLFNSNSLTNCANVDATYTEDEGIVSLYKAEIAADCTQTSSWTNNTEYQDRCFMDLLRTWATETAAKDTVAKELIWSNGASEPGPHDYLVGGESENVITTGLLGKPLTGSISVDAISESREVADKYNDVGAYANGILYEYYDQLYEVEQYLFPSLCYICVSVFFCSLIFILHPIAAFVMLISLIVTLVELWGFLTWADIKVNGLLALNMVVACGVTVEFSAHINRRFMLESGTPRERLATALGVLFIPVTLGGATSIIAVSFMAFSDMPYTRIYYFRLFSMMIALGYWNGVFFQSILILLVAKCTTGTCLELSTISRQRRESSIVKTEVPSTNGVELATSGENGGNKKKTEVYLNSSDEMNC